MKDIVETLQVLQDTPVPNLLVIAGLALLDFVHFGVFRPIFTDFSRFWVILAILTPCI